jgi:hypothetical protein
VVRHLPLHQAGLVIRPMDIMSILSSVTFIGILVFLGWLFGRSWHSDIPKKDQIQLPLWTKVFLGPPNSNGYYSVRGIYFQIFTVLYAVPFLLVEFQVLTKRTAFVSLALGMCVIAFLELIRWTTNKK